MHKTVLTRVHGVLLEHHNFAEDPEHQSHLEDEDGVESVKPNRVMPPPLWRRYVTAGHRNQKLASLDASKSMVKNQLRGLI